MVNYGFFGEIDVAVIEAPAIAPDGRVWLTSGGRQRAHRCYGRRK